MRKSAICFVISLLCLCAAAVSAQENTGIELKPLRGQVYQAAGIRGGNVLLHMGEDGVLLVDAGTRAEDKDLLAQAIETVTDKSVSYLINTHWHGDHTGSNVGWGQAGVTLVGHENMAASVQKTIHMDFFGNDSPPLEKAGWPTVTFKDTHILRFNGEKIDLIHLGAGHTDGDAIVVFNDANVVHMGDLFFNGYYPYIGVSSGGSLPGMIKVINWTLKEMDDNTIVVPGHGPVSDKAGLKVYVEMLTAIYQRVDALIKEGKDLAAIQVAKPTADYDEAWGQIWMSGDEFVKLVVMNLKQLQ